MPGAPAYVFMIDVSYQSMQCGMVRMLMKELKEVLDVLPKWVFLLLISELDYQEFTHFFLFLLYREHGQEASSVRVGFVTYSNHLHFYNVKVN